jgi:hypothetical protein
VKKKKDTKVKARKLNRLEKANRKEERIFQIRQEARLETLNGLLEMVESNIVIDAWALRELISDINGATTKVDEIQSVLLARPFEGMAVGDLAEWVGVDPRTMRSFLRDTFPKAAPGKGGNWYVTDKMIAAAEARWPKV